MGSSAGLCGGSAPPWPTSGHHPDVTEHRAGKRRAGSRGFSSQDKPAPAHAGQEHMDSLLGRVFRPGFPVSVEPAAQASSSQKPRRHSPLLRLGPLPASHQTPSVLPSSPSRCREFICLPLSSRPSPTTSLWSPPPPCLVIATVACWPPLSSPHCCWNDLSGAGIWSVTC